MSISNEEKIITVFLQQFNRLFMPVLQQLKSKVDSGEELDLSELAFIEQVLIATHDILPKIITHRQYSHIFIGAIRYYISITEQALENTR